MWRQENTYTYTYTHTPLEVEHDPATCLLCVSGNFPKFLDPHLQTRFLRGWKGVRCQLQLAQHLAQKHHSFLRKHVPVLRTECRLVKWRSASWEVGDGFRPIAQNRGLDTDNAIPQSSWEHCWERLRTVGKRRKTKGKEAGPPFKLGDSNCYEYKGNNPAQVWFL